MGIFNLVGDWIKRVFSSGGEKYTGSAIDRGFPPETIIERLQKKFGPTETPDLETTIEFGKAGNRFGIDLTASLGEGGIDLESAPINPYLFGDTPAGNRFFWRGRVYVEELGHFINIDIIAPDYLSGDDLLEEFRREALRRICGSPRAFGLEDCVDIEPTTVEIIFGERRF